MCLTMAAHRSSNRRGCARAARKFASAALLPLLLILSCDTLFLPSAGSPEEGPAIRSTPRGTIEQLFRAYENKRIDLFTELLPKNGTFRFFISPDYTADYTAMPNTDAIIARVEEPEYEYVRAGTYYFWDHESELAKHRRLFRMAGAIEFTEYPLIDERDFRYRESGNGDTTVEVRMMGGELCISARDTLYCTPKDRQVQVFLLEREVDRRTGNKLWVIRDWFDLNSF